MEFFTEALIKIRPRLIEQQQFRMMRQRKSKCKLQLFSLGQFLIFFLSIQPESLKIFL